MEGNVKPRLDLAPPSSYTGNTGLSLSRRSSDIYTTIGLGTSHICLEKSEQQSIVACNETTPIWRFGNNVNATSSGQI